MSGAPERKGLSPALAAFFILLGTGVVFYFLPRVMIALGDVSPWLAGVVGTLLVLAFFLVFWLRARYQRRRGN
jgi:protein-S-isoprenylcysteine O-methyltransferase Ste14